MDGKCLRGAVRADGSRAFVMTAVRHGDALTAALREIGAKTNEILEFAALLDAADDTDLADAVVTVDALHAQNEHARYLVEDRGAHYLLSVKNNQPTLAGQLRALPWKDVPVLDRSRDRGHGREEVRAVKVCSVDGLLFPPRPSGRADLIIRIVDHIGQTSGTVSPYDLVPKIRCSTLRSVHSGVRRLLLYPRQHRGAMRLANVLRWSHWRRRHQHRAATCHRRWNEITAATTT